MVKPITKLVHILLHIFYRYVMEYAIHTAFKYSPKTLDVVGMYSVLQKYATLCSTFNPTKVHSFFLSMIL